MTLVDKLAASRVLASDIVNIDLTYVNSLHIRLAGINIKALVMEIDVMNKAEPSAASLGLIRGYHARIREISLGCGRDGQSDTMARLLRRVEKFLFLRYGVGFELKREAA